MLRLIGAGSPPLHRVKTGVEFALHGRHDLHGMISRHAAARPHAGRGARALGRGARWPRRRLRAVGRQGLARRAVGGGRSHRGPDRGARRVHRGGPPGAGDRRRPGAVAKGRSGTQFDPELADCLRADAETSSAGSTRSRRGRRSSTPSRRSPSSSPTTSSTRRCWPSPTSSTSSRRTRWATPAPSPTWPPPRARTSASTNAEVRALRRAGLVHGFGRLGVSNGIWDKPGPLAAGEWERVRMQPYLTGRMLQQSEALAPLGALAIQHRERLDGSGYPAWPVRRRDLAAGPRPRRRRRLPVDARAAPVPPGALGRRGCRGAARRGQGRPSRRRRRRCRARRGRPSRGRRREGPAGLTAREVDVLRLLARGLSNKEISAKLVISPKTARNHVEHIYTKTGATSRVTASLFAMQHGLLPDDALS